MGIDPINIGLAPNTRTGDKLRAAFAKVNAAFQYLLSPPRWDLSAPNLTASWRPDGSGNLCLYIGVAGAGDGAQIKVATVNKTTGVMKLELPAIIGGGLNLSAAGVDTGTGASLYFVGFGAFQTVLAGAAVAFNTGANNARTERMRIDSSGNVSIGTTASAAPLYVFGLNEIGRFEALNSEAYLVVNQAADPAVTGARPVFQLRKHNVACLQISAEGSAAAAGQVYYEALGTAASHWFFGNSVRPGADNATTLAVPGAAFSTGYFKTSPIITSDARTKLTVDGEEITEDTGWGVTPYTEAQLRVSRRMAAGIGLYKTKDAVEKKGLAEARQHSGLTVQFGLAACAAEGVDPWSLGIFCRDEITRRVKTTRMVERQKMEPVEPEAVVEIIDGVPTRVLRERKPQPVFTMKPLIGLDGKPEMETVQPDPENPDSVRIEPVMHPVPVMVEVPEDVWIDEPAGETLSFRIDELQYFLIAGMAAEV